MIQLYDFDERFRAGARGAAMLDAHFKKKYKVGHVNQDRQALGIDREFIGEHGEVLSMEYKTDERAADTGRAFIETVSVEKEGRYSLGWLFTSRANYVVIYVPTRCLAYVCKMDEMRRRYDERWRHAYPEKVVVSRRRGDEWKTRGICVPLMVLAECPGVRMEQIGVNHPDSETLP